MRMCVFVLAVAAVLGFEGQSRADKKGPPQSHKEVTAGGKYVFVMLAPQPVEDEIKSYGTEDAKNTVIAMRNVYKKSGLYKNDGSAEPLWTVDWYGAATVLSDGVHLIRWGQP